MIRLPAFLAAAIRRLTSWGRRRLVSASTDNIVFRHEIGMDSFGRLRPGSPIYAAHLSMGTWMAATGLTWGLAGPVAAALTLGGPMLILAVGAYPFAVWRAFRNLGDERRSGALDQLYLSALEPQEIFEGKLYGLLSPLLEARRWMTPIGALFVWCVFRIADAPWFLLALAGWLTGLNHFGHSVVMGTMAGLKGASMGEAGVGSVLRDWRMSPWLWHLWLLARVGALIAVPLVILLWLGRRADVVLYPAFMLVLMMPFYAAEQLARREQRERKRLAQTFRQTFSIEGSKRSVTPG